MRKNFLIKVLSLILACGCVLPAFGCVGNDDGGIDKTKTQIYVGNYYGGLGDEWLVEIKERFENQYANYTLGEKVGVQIVIDNNKDGLSGEKLIETIGGSQNEVFFTEKVTLNEYMDRNLLYDITDVVTGDLSGVAPSESGVSIESKVNANVKDYIRRDGKYYALPFYEGYYGLIYDVELFETKGLFFKEGYEKELTLEDKFVVDSQSIKSAGPDGESETIDDGLPVTYEDFIDLCDYMKVSGVTPLVYPGKYMHYWTRMLFNLWANNEGAEQMNLNFQLSGTAKTLVSVDGSGVITSIGDLPITSENAYELQKQSGKYYTLDFIRELARSNYFSANSSSTAQSHMSAQEDFIYGNLESSLETIGMLLDGNWFESEATGIFSDTVASYGQRASKQNRRLAVMPLPRSSKSSNTKSTYVCTNNSFCFMNANCKQSKVELVKDFIRFCHTNKSLSAFNEITSVPRPFTYTLENEDKLTNYGKSSYSIHKNSDIVFPYSTNSYFLSKSSTFELNSWSFNTVVRNTPYNNPFTAFKANSGLTVKEYFDGMYTTQKNVLTK